MRYPVLAFLLFAFLATSAFSWPSKDKSGKTVAECPYMQQKYADDGPGVGHAALKACPLKDKCPLYAAVVHGEADISFDSLNAEGANWSQAAQKCPLAHVCPYLRDTPPDLREFSKLPKDHLEKLLSKCPRLATSPQAKQHVEAALFHDDAHHSDQHAGTCPFLSRPADDASISQWEDFYKHAAECPWIQEHGMSSLAKSPIAWQAALDKCPVVQEMSAEKAAHYELRASSAKKIFDFLFPSTPAINSLLATAYISGPPNFFLALVPPNINPSSLNTLVAFAVGGLLGDVFLHLLPQVFMGEGNDGKVHFVLLEENRNTVLGLAIFVGFVAFLIIDKSMRILSGGEGHDHTHHAPTIESSSNGTSTTIETHTEKKNLRKRKTDAKDTKEEVHPSEKEPPKQQVKASAWLCIISDFTHNITDGLAMSASFYISPSIGAITTMAVFFHEIPHEVGDFAILVQSGFTKYQAISAQLFTALGAFLGTLIGIAIQHYSGVSTGNVAGLFGTSVTPGDLVLPFTAGGFMYIGTVGVIPELLVIEGKKSVSQEFRDGLVQLVAMFVGIGMMAIVSWD